MNTFELDKTYIANTYARFPVEIVSGQGALCRDADGNEYIDLGTGIGVNIFGYADAQWISAVTAMAEYGSAYFQSLLFRAVRPACRDALPKRPG